MCLAYFRSFQPCVGDLEMLVNYLINNDSYDTNYPRYVSIYGVSIHI